MIDTLKKDLAAAEAARKRLGESLELTSASLERRFYDGYITAIKYAIVVIKEHNRDKASNPFLKGVEQCQ